MYFLDYLPPAIGEFMGAMTGSLEYEHALAWSLVAVVCILAILALL